MDSSKNKALISRIHARISRSETPNGGDVFKIQDVSLNGTYVNDLKISSEALLTPGDVVTFGHVQGACLESGNCYKQLNSEFKFLVCLWNVFVYISAIYFFIDISQSIFTNYWLD